MSDGEGEISGCGENQDVEKLCMKWSLGVLYEVRKMGKASVT